MSPHRDISERTRSLRHIDEGMHHQRRYGRVCRGNIRQPREEHSGPMLELDLRTGHDRTLQSMEFQPLESRQGPPEGGVISDNDLSVRIDHLSLFGGDGAAPHETEGGIPLVGGGGIFGSHGSSSSRRVAGVLGSPERVDDLVVGVDVVIVQAQVETEARGAGQFHGFPHRGRTGGFAFGPIVIGIGVGVGVGIGMIDVNDVFLIDRTAIVNASHLIGPSSRPLDGIGPDAGPVDRLDDGLDRGSDDDPQRRCEFGREHVPDVLFAVGAALERGPEGFEARADRGTIWALAVRGVVHHVPFDLRIRVRIDIDGTMEGTAPVPLPRFQIAAIAASPGRRLVKGHLMTDVIAGLEARIAEDAGVVVLARAAVPRNVARAEDVPAGPDGEAGGGGRAGEQALLGEVLTVEGFEVGCELVGVLGRRGCGCKSGCERGCRGFGGGRRWDEGGFGFEFGQEVRFALGEDGTGVVVVVVIVCTVVVCIVVEVGEDHGIGPLADVGRMEARQGSKRGFRQHRQRGQAMRQRDRTTTCIFVLVRCRVCLSLSLNLSRCLGVVAEGILAQGIIGQQRFLHECVWSEIAQVVPVRVLVAVVHAAGDKVQVRRQGIRRLRLRAGSVRVRVRVVAIARVDGR